MAHSATVDDYRRHADLLPYAPVPADVAEPPPGAGPTRPAGYAVPVSDTTSRMGLAQALGSLAGAVGVVLAVPLLVAVLAFVLMSAWTLVRGRV
jgi:hypothetical protein